jgi:hypothetical protein
MIDFCHNLHTVAAEADRYDGSQQTAKNTGDVGKGWVC